MDKEDMVRKLTSRKFWVAIAEFVTMLLVAFHVAESEAAQIASIIMAGGAVIAYIVGEGLADAAGAAAGTIELTGEYVEENKPPEEAEG